MKKPATRFEGLDGSFGKKPTHLILAKDLEYGDVSELTQLHKLLEAYSQVILNSGF